MKTTVLRQPGISIMLQIRNNYVNVFKIAS